MDIETRLLSKRYPLKTALQDVSVKLEGGKIHALVGENGAGKSTLAKLLAGGLFPSSGQILLDGKETLFSSAGDALRNKIVLVRQRPLLAESLSARENIILKTTSDDTRKHFFLRPPSKELLQLRDSWCPQLNLNMKVKDLGGNMRFYISLIGSLLRNPACLLLDEPSAFLSVDERSFLYERLKEYAARGMNVIVITHSYSEAVSYPDTISLLKDGTLVRQFFDREAYKEYHLKNTAEEIGINSLSLHSLPKPVNRKKPCIRLTSASVSSKNKPALLDASLEAYYGEITAVTGVKEAAMETLEDLLTGLEDGRETGSFTFTDREGRSEELNLAKRKLNAAFIRSKKGAIVPSDKNFRASNPQLSVLQMLSVYVEHEKEKLTVAHSLLKKAEIRIDLHENCSALSGGMLQRLILARELSIEPTFVILCNPMHGLDIESQGRLCRQIKSLAAAGKAVLLLGAEDFPLSMCTKVYSLEAGISKLVFSKGAA